MQTSTQMTLNLKQGRRLKEEGIAKVASRNGTWLETMRSVARMICRKNGTVTADHIKAWAEANELHPTHKNAYGAVFKTGEFEPCGYTQSSSVSRHSGTIRIWRLK